MRTILFTLLIWNVCQLSAAVVFPDAVGKQTPENTYRAALKLVYQSNLESSSIPGSSLGTGFYTTDSSKVLSGNQSIYLPIGTYLVFDPDKLNFIGGTTYTVEFDYAILDTTVYNTPLLVGFTWPDFEGAFSGPVPGIYPERGTYRHNMRLPEDQTSFKLVFATPHAGVAIDKIRIYALIPEVSPAEPPMLKIGFPRLSNFQVFSTDFLARKYGKDIETVRDALARFDFVNGLNINHLFGGEVDYIPLKLRNPDILLLPYHPTFLSIQIDELGALSESSHLSWQFNNGLAEEWFMRGPDGAKLFELAYPDNFQMNSTDFCPEVDGVTFNDYTIQFLTESVYPTGYWSGVHFDQSEWFPNPLLAEEDPFNNQSSIVVPTDLNNDGQAESRAEVFTAMLSGFKNYFSKLDELAGASFISFGNAGEMPKNEDVLRLLNGFQFEYFSPYPLSEDGSFHTSGPTNWYRYISLHEHARHYLRSPQVPSTQMTGKNLGQANGLTTSNGVPDREPFLTPEDYDRMRFGLASALLTDGFFGYDFIDNSTLPFPWLDEYAVDLVSGKPDLQGKHYLGQPLGDAIELDYAKVYLVNIDFESGIPSDLPPGFSLNPSLIELTDPNLVIEGTGSALLELNQGTDNPDEFAWTQIFLSDGNLFSLSTNTVYQTFIDYRIVSFNSSQFENILTMGFYSQDSLLGLGNSETLWYQGTNVGQTGTLRAAYKTDGSGYRTSAILNDTCQIALDNIRIVEGIGGVFRRDFENGIVLVNPTPETKILTMGEMEGPLQRTGLRRISGNQVPSLNTGLPVTGDIILSSGDGIILLADPVSAPPPLTPESILTVGIGEDLLLIWQNGGGTVSGYAINFGMTYGDLTRYKMAGLTDRILIENLEPGRAYDFRIAAFDYLGNLSEYSPPVTYIVPGSPPQEVPAFIVGNNITPGATSTLLGMDLTSTSQQFQEGNYPLEAGGIQVFVNGLPTELASISPTTIEFFAAENLVGNKAIIRLEKNGISSVSHYVMLEPPGGNDQIPIFSTRYDSNSHELRVEWNSTPLEPFQIESSIDGINWFSFGKVFRPITGHTETSIPLEPFSESLELFRIIKSN